MKKFTLTLIACVLLLSIPAWALAVTDQEKLDDQITAGNKTFAIFVRAQDQLFSAAGDYERFCDQQPAGTKRLELRKQVLKTLQDKADASFKEMQQKVEQLVSDGQVRNVQRYWIVNGFACEATGKAAHALAELESVGFVYRQRFAPQQRTPVNRKGAKVDENLTLNRKLLKNLTDDSDEPFDGSKCEIPWNLKRVKADRVWAGLPGAKRGYTGRGVVVAVLDSGMMSIPALTSALWMNSDETFNGKDDDHTEHFVLESSPGVLTVTKQNAPS